MALGEVLENVQLQVMNSMLALLTGLSWQDVTAPGVFVEWQRVNASNEG